MEPCVKTFEARLSSPWLTDAATQRLVLERFRHICKTFAHRPQWSVAVIACEAPADTLAAVLAALATATPAFLANPQWTPEEKAQAQKVIARPQLWIGDAHTVTATHSAEGQAATPPAAAGAPAAHNFANTAKAVTAGTAPVIAHAAASADAPTAIPADAAPQMQTPPQTGADPLAGCLFIPTGGTGGRLKFACHTFDTLAAAVRGYAAFWQIEKIHCICALPVFHIGGLMLALRTFLSGGRLWLLPWEQLQQLAAAVVADSSATPVPAPPPAQTAAGAGVFAGATSAEQTSSNAFAAATAANGAQGFGWHLSLVPTQIARLLPSAAACAWLRSLHAVLTGGGATALPLLQQAAALRIPLCPAYGMTESAATIALQRPADFLRQYAAPPATEPHARTTTVLPRTPQPDAPADAFAGADTPPDASAQPDAEQPPQGEVLPHLRIRIETTPVTAAAAGTTNASAPRLAPPDTVVAAASTGTATNATADAAATNAPAQGRIVIEGESLFLGYYPAAPQRQNAFATSDLGQISTNGNAPANTNATDRLQVLGRLDRVIVTGGKKVDPALVEQAIRQAAAQLIADARRTNSTNTPPRSDNRHGANNPTSALCHPGVNNSTGAPCHTSAMPALPLPLHCAGGPGGGLLNVLVCGVADARWGERVVAFVEIPATAEQTPATPVPPANLPGSACPPAAVAADAVNTAGAPRLPTAADAAAAATTTTNTANAANANALTALIEAVAARLPAYQRPKQWIAVGTLPLDARGKPEHARIRRLCDSQPRHDGHGC